MLLGEFEHSLDDKNRVTLPARFPAARSPMASSSRAASIPACSSIRPTAGTPRRTAACEGLDPFSREARQMSRYLFAGAIETELDKQGRVMLPGPLVEARPPRAGDRRRGRPRSPRALGAGRLAQGARRRRKECGACCRAPRSRISADHVPVLADEVRELLAVQPGETVIDATFGAGGHARLLAADLAGKGRFIAIDRDPDARTYFDRFRARARRPGTASCAATSPPSSASSPQTACAPTRSSSTSASRACRSTGPSAASRTRSTRRSTCAWIPSAPRSAREIVNEASERELADVFRRYGEERFARPIARAIVRRRAGAALRAHARPRRDRPRGDPCAAPLRRRASGQARVPGAPDRRERRARLPRARAARGASPMLRPGGRIAVISFHSLEDRIVKRFLAAEARGCICPPDLPVCALRPRAAAAPRDAQGRAPLARPRWPRTPARRPRGCASRSGRRSTDGRHRASPCHIRARSARLRDRRPARGVTPAPPRPRAARPRVAGGVLWIVLVAVLLAGIVAVNVAALR